MRVIYLSQDQFYGDDKSRDLIDDLIRVINLEILSLAKHGCKHIQLDEPVLMRYPEKALEYGVTDVIKCFEGTMVLLKYVNQKMAFLGFEMDFFRIFNITLG